MVSKELKKLSRRDLIDIIYQMKKNEQKMEAEMNALKEALDDKHLRLSEAGSIAEAATSITDVFAVAQKTADLYLQEISFMKEETRKECIKRIEEADDTVRKLLSYGKEEYNRLLARYQADYEKWTQLCGKIETLENSKQSE